MDRSKIISFWTWFKANSNALFLDLRNKDILGELDHKIQDIVNLDWEIGPYSDNVCFLAISPNLDKNALKFAQEFVSFAPHCANWIFLSEKPEKGWLGNWVMENEIGQMINIDANTWRYILYEYDNKELEMDVFVNIYGDINTAYKAVDIVITNLLGEAKYMTLFENVTVIEDVNNFDFSKSSILSNLKQHLIELKFLS